MIGASSDTDGQLNQRFPLAWVNRPRTTPVSILRIRRPRAVKSNGGQRPLKHRAIPRRPAHFKRLGSARKINPHSFERKPTLLPASQRVGEVRLWLIGNHIMPPQSFGPHDEVE